MLTLDLGSLDAAKCFMERLQNKHSFGARGRALAWKLPSSCLPAPATKRRQSVLPPSAAPKPLPVPPSCSACFLALCPAGLLAVSLGYFDTLMSASAASTSSELLPAELAAAGIGPGLVRLSVGLTGSLEQRWAQLEEAYRHVATVPPGTKPGYKAVQVGRGQASGAGLPACGRLAWDPGFRVACLPACRFCPLQTQAPRSCTAR